MDADTNNMIKDILSSNDVAFVIGNGINQHFFSDVKSWQKLLESLWIRYCQNTSSGNDWERFVDSKTGYLRGITPTELFDLIEMNYYGSNTPSGLLRLLQQRNIPPIKFKELDSIAKAGLKEFDLKSFGKSNVNFGQEFDKFTQTNSIFIEKCRNWCNENIAIDTNTLSDGDCVLIMMELLSNSTKIQLYRNQLKKDIANEYQPDKKDVNLGSFMKKIANREAPVLTTNFDTYMSSSVGLELFKMESGFTDFYPWNVYFSNHPLRSPISGFAVWHINGLKNYHRSIRLGLSDYMGSVQRARNMIHFNNMNEFFDGKNRENWIGHNTWLHIVFNKPLFIFGLALNENEVFLRWLLIQRAKYSKMYGRDLRGWFVDKNINDGKRVFLETLGFTVVSVKDFKELYDAFN